MKGEEKSQKSFLTPYWGKKEEKKRGGKHFFDPQQREKDLVLHHPPWEKGRKSKSRPSLLLLSEKKKRANSGKAQNLVGHFCHPGVKNGKKTPRGANAWWVALRLLG